MNHIDIGDKIRRLRQQRGMTQAELVGDQITRNMLSRMENGAALPSLPTVWYLAERLGVPAGFLLAEGDDDRIWQKMSRITRIRRAWQSGDARLCLALCRGEDDSDEGDEPDDEMKLLMAQCCLRIAGEEFEEGHLHRCCTYLDEALELARETMYDTTGIECEARLYFRFMHRLSALLYSEMLDEEQTEDMLIGSTTPFGRYVIAERALEMGDTARVDAYFATTDEADVWQQHLHAHRLMRQGDFLQADELLVRLLNAQQSRGEVLVYCVFCDLEVCCREMGDFRRAYEYAHNKVALLERMLQD